MKKYVGVVLIVLTLSGCAQARPSTKENKENILSSHRVADTPLTTGKIVKDTLAIVPSLFSSLLPLVLEETSLVEVPVPAQEFVIQNASTQQFRRFFKLDNYYLALVQHSSSNSFIASDVSTSTGIWYASATNSILEWKPWLMIIGPSYVENNPFYIWNEREVVHVLLIDNRGAGSGEGIAKVLTSLDAGMHWSVSKCFYYTPEGFPELQGNKIFKGNFGNAVQKYVAQKKKWYNRESIFNSSTSEFEFSEFNKMTGQQEVVSNENCKNIVMP